ncbi:MAG: trehalase family glycosidase [Vicinamibacteria bacterium]
MSHSERYDAMLQRVEALYERNRQRGTAAWCGHDYDFVCPSTGTYPFQWFWDSCFHAIVLARYDMVRARSEIRSLLQNQPDDGFVGHVTFWQREAFEEMLKEYSIAYRTPYLSDCIQPPLLAEALFAITRGEGGQEVLNDLLPKVQKYYDWLDRMRDPDRDGLIAILQPDESGLDHIPKYDKYLGVAIPNRDEFTLAWQRAVGSYAEMQRDHDKMFEADRFVVEDVLVNTIYAENQRVLAELHEEAGDQASAATMHARAAKTVDALVKKCWDSKTGLFFDLAGKREEQLNVSTVTSLMPILLPDLPRDMVEALARHIADPKEYAAAYPIPSAALNEPLYMKASDDHPEIDSKLLWRGPSWINTNWYIARGLRRHGFVDLARTIEDKSAELIEKGGFREYYDPYDGDGFGAHAFSWTALVLNMLADHEGVA